MFQSTTLCLFTKTDLTVQQKYILFLLSNPCSQVIFITRVITCAISALMHIAMSKYSASHLPLSKYDILWCLWCYTDSTIYRINFDKINYNSVRLKYRHVQAQSRKPISLKCIQAVDQSFELLLRDLVLLIQTDNSAAVYERANSIVGFNLISFLCRETGSDGLRQDENDTCIAEK